MGDKNPKNIHKQAAQKHEEHVEKVEHKHENAERQHHPVSGHPDPETGAITDAPVEQEGEAEKS